METTTSKRKAKTERASKKKVKPLAKLTISDGHRSNCVRFSGYPGVSEDCSCGVG
jgi:hypothetical protein